MWSDGSNKLHNWPAPRVQPLWIYKDYDPKDPHPNSSESIHPTKISDRYRLYCVRIRMRNHTDMEISSTYFGQVTLLDPIAELHTIITNGHGWTSSYCRKF